MLDEKLKVKIAALPELRVGVPRDQPPFVYVDAKGAHKGLSAEVLATLISHTGLKVRIVPGTSTAALLAQMTAGDLDLVLSVNGAAPGVNTKLLSVPYLVSTLGGFVPKGEIFLGELRDLFGQRVVLHSGGLTQAMLAVYPRISLQAVLNNMADFKQLVVQCAQVHDGRMQHIELHALDRVFNISVADAGQGIKLEDMDKLFR